MATLILRDQPKSTDRMFHCRIAQCSMNYGVCKSKQNRKCVFPISRPVLNGVIYRGWGGVRLVGEKKEGREQMFFEKTAPVILTDHLQPSTTFLPSTGENYEISKESNILVSPLFFAWVMNWDRRPNLTKLKLKYVADICQWMDFLRLTLELNVLTISTLISGDQSEPRPFDLGFGIRVGDMRTLKSKPCFSLQSHQEEKSLHLPWNKWERRRSDQDAKTSA